MGRPREGPRHFLQGMGGHQSYTLAGEAKIRRRVYLQGTAKLAVVLR